ncbi:hypothetical protein SPURM210S_01787 [Streptomyces purpurascens]
MDWTFLTEAARDPRTTGAVAPSGKALARALTDPVRTWAQGPLTVLEAGAGTGAVTRALIPQLHPGSSLDVVEANPRFADRLRRLVDTHPHLARSPSGSASTAPTSRTSPANSASDRLRPAPDQLHP